MTSSAAGPLSATEIDESVARFLESLPPGTDATLVAITLIRGGLDYFVQTRGREVAERTAQCVLDCLCDQER